MSGISEMAEVVHEGGCLCGALRFAAEGEAEAVGYCHCRMCQRSSGAPAQVWALFPAGAVRVTAGAPVVYRSSEHGSRDFCATCGSQVGFHDADGYSLNVACLDDPEAMAPTCHIWTESRISWFDAGKGLPERTQD